MHGEGDAMGGRGDGPKYFLWLDGVNKTDGVILEPPLKTNHKFCKKKDIIFTTSLQDFFTLYNPPKYYHLNNNYLFNSNYLNNSSKRQP